MRIIAGEFRGRTLKAPKGEGTRPTTDRVREAMMSTVHSARGGFDDAVVLDAFAGSGALGLEALSRGARSVQFCERGGEALRALNANVRLLGLDARRARVRKGDVLKDVPYARPPFDLVFLDPPYACAAAEVLGLVAHARGAVRRCHRGVRACLGGERRGGGSGKSARFVYCAAQEVRGYCRGRAARYSAARCDRLKPRRNGKPYMKRALTPGTFDPITSGHLDVITRAAQLVDEVVVAVAASPKKKPLFSLEERAELVRRATSHLPNVRVEPFDELLVDLAAKLDATVVIKGLRAITDFEYEFQMTALNYQLNQELETLFIMSPPQYMYLSSSIVREIASLHGDVAQFVPACVNEALLKKFGDA